jgi:uncharacterized protein with gpF-like domain
MAFRASSKRERRVRPPIAEGYQMIPSAPIRDWYTEQLQKVIGLYVNEARKELNKVVKNPAVKGFFAEDAASPIPKFDKALIAIRKRYEAIFSQTAQKLSEAFVNKVDKHSVATTNASLGKLGVEYVDRKPGDLNVILKSQIAENVRLITKVGQDVFDRVEMAVNQSMMSPDSGEQGIAGIYNHLTQIEGMSDRRAKLIATDQTKKVYSALNTQRMENSGLQKFKWIHSSAGKTPRHSHVERDGKIYLLKGGASELYNVDGSDANAEVPENDRGKPGFAINCRCRMVAVLDLDF